MDNGTTEESSDRKVTMSDVILTAEDFIKAVEASDQNDK